ncbi:hypothetical protein Bca4012_048069 [Brassica carinata]|uniref:Uncharacterized protein n=1 Tax=Brassica carinata TaxID=52824 RepID=A0A8X7UJE7_BRACI|nr:hypothetical protein Bca52824_051016 [Brassica carinata]
MNSALDFAFPAANLTSVGGIRRGIPSPGLLGSRLRVFSLPPPSSSSLKVNISFPEKNSIVPMYLFGHCRRWITSLHKAHQITSRSPTISTEFSRLSG